jgi:hypothetical protein
VNLYDAMMHRFIASVFALLLACWLASAVAGGIAAASIFPAARELALSLAVFETANYMQCWLAPCTVVVFIMLGISGPRGSWRSAALLVAVSSFAALLWWAQPAFTAADAQYRDAARGGDVAAALALKPAVDSAHALASNCAKIEVLALLVLIASSSSTSARGKSGNGSNRVVAVGWSSRRG